MQGVKSLGSTLIAQVLLIAITSRFMLMSMNWFSFKIFRVVERGYPKRFDELIPVVNPLSGWSR